MNKKNFTILPATVFLFLFLSKTAFSQINLDWAKYYHSGGVPSNEEAISLCSDIGLNVYVAGSGSGNVYKIIKYSPDGNSEWDRYYSGGTPNKIIYNGSDIIFVSGSNGLLKLDRQGNLMLFKNGYIAGVTKGQDNFIYAVSSLSNQIITDKYNLDGSLVWSKIKLHSQPGGSYYSYRFFQGAGNNINVFGYYSYVTIFLITGYTNTSYDTLGNLLFDGGIPVGSSKEVRDNYSNNNYFIGYSEQSIWQSEIVVWKINTSNSILDTIRYNGPGNSRDEPYDIATDDLGNVYVACRSWGISVNYDFVILKYNSDGNLVWEYRYNGSENSYDAAEKIKLDNSGNIYASGTVTLNSHGIQIYTVKLSPDGQLLWSDNFSRYNSITDSNYVRDLQIDNSNNIYLCGKSRDSVSRKYDFLTVKYSQPTSVVNHNEIMNKDFYLLENYPNPFNPETKIKFNLPDKSNVRINIFSSDGKSVLELLNSDYSAGAHTVVWNAQSLPTGIYFISFSAGNFKEIRKAVLIK